MPHCTPTRAAESVSAPRAGLAQFREQRRNSDCIRRLTAIFFARSALVRAPRTCTSTRIPVTSASRFRTSQQQPRRQLPQLAGDRGVISRNEQAFPPGSFLTRLASSERARGGIRRCSRSQFRQASRRAGQRLQFPDGGEQFADLVRGASRDVREGDDEYYSSFREAGESANHHARLAAARAAGARRAGAVVALAAVLNYLTLRFAAEPTSLPASLLLSVQQRAAREDRVLPAREPERDGRASWARCRRS